MLIFSPTFVQFRHIKKSVIVRFDIDEKSTEIHEILIIFTLEGVRARAVAVLWLNFSFFLPESSLTF